MNKLRAKVKLISKEDASYLIKAFFQEVNVENSIIIKENEATIEVFFDQIPEKLIKAIYHCEIITFEIVGQEQDYDIEDDSIFKPRPIEGFNSDEEFELQMFREEDYYKTAGNPISIPNIDEKEGNKPEKKRGRTTKKGKEKEVNEEKNPVFETLRES